MTDKPLVSIVTMTDKPLVSIVTPTFPGREVELMRCIDRVIALEYPRIQHVIVSDRRPDSEELTLWNQWWGRMLEAVPARWSAELQRFATIVEINESWRNPTTEASIGAIPWYVGSLLAMGEFVGFCGDDDELLPDHVTRHVAAMTEHEAMFSVSGVQFRAGGVDQFVVGPDFAHGSLDATGIMCHRDALQVCNWTANGENAADWRLVRDWLARGLVGTLVLGEPTGIHNDGWLVGKTGRPDRPQ
jgi:hypothetical protein